MRDLEGATMATVFVRVPFEVRIADGENKEECNKLCSLLSKHGYKMSYFAHDEITFFVMSEVSEEGFVPIDARYCMSRREFAAFLCVIRKLDAAETKVNQLMLDWATHTLEPSW
jgi:hypothetical protein